MKPQLLVKIQVGECTYFRIAVPQSQANPTLRILTRLLGAEHSGQIVCRAVDSKTFSPWPSDPREGQVIWNGFYPTITTTPHNGLIALRYLERKAFWAKQEEGHGADLFLIETTEARTPICWKQTRSDGRSDWGVDLQLVEALTSLFVTWGITADIKALNGGANLTLGPHHLYHFRLRRMMFWRIADRNGKLTFMLVHELPNRKIHIHVNGLWVTLFAKMRRLTK